MHVDLGIARVGVTAHTLNTVLGVKVCRSAFCRLALQ